MRHPFIHFFQFSFYSFEVTLIGIGILLTILALISSLIMGPLFANELLILDLFLIIGLETKNQDPQVTGMCTGQSSCNAVVGCQVLILNLRAMDLDEALKLLSEELLLEV